MGEKVIGKEEVLWNRETGVISAAGDIDFAEYQGTVGEFGELYVPVQVKVSEVEGGYVLEGVTAANEPVRASLDADDYFAGKEFVNEFDKERKREQVKVLYAEALLAPVGDGFDQSWEAYGKLVDSLKDSELLSMEEVKEIEKEVGQLDVDALNEFGKGRKREQVKASWAKVLVVPEGEYEQQFAEHQKLVKSLVERELLSEEEILEIEMGVSELHADELNKVAGLEVQSTVNLQQEVEKHGEELLDVIDKHVIQDEEGRSYISSDELEGLLKNHFIQVEDLLKSHTEPSYLSKLTDKVKSTPEKLRALRVELGNQITTSVNVTKDIAQEKKDVVVDKVVGKAGQVRESIGGVIQSAKAFVKRGILNLNQKLQDFTKSVEQKLVVDDVKKGPTGSRAKGFRKTAQAFER